MKSKTLLLVSILLLLGSVSAGATGGDDDIVSWVDWENLDPPRLDDARELQEWVLEVTEKSAPPTLYMVSPIGIDLTIAVEGGSLELASLGTKHHDENGCSIPGLFSNIFLVNWTGHPVCNGHDNCYQHASSFGESQFSCDFELKNTLEDWCLSNYRSICGNSEECLQTCADAVETVYQGLRFAGSPAFNRGRNDDSHDCEWGRRHGNRHHNDGYCCDSDVHGPSGSGPASCADEPEDEGEMGPGGPGGEGGADDEEGEPVDTCDPEPGCECGRWVTEWQCAACGGDWGAWCGGTCCG